MLFRELVLIQHGDKLDETTRKAFESFKASSEWLSNYLHRRETRSVRRCVEHSSIDPVVIDARLHTIQILLQNIPLCDIWNLDETTLQYRTTSSRSYVTSNFEGCGTKRSKEHVNITPTVSAAGEKFVRQVIGKSKRLVL